MPNLAYTGTLFIVSAPSGAGKSSLIQAYLAQQHVNLAKVSVSHTTRAPRIGEKNGEHYHFVDLPHFEQMIVADDFVEYAHVFENYYGTAKSAIEQDLCQGIDVFLDIDWQGAQQVRQKIPSAHSLFILPPSLTELENRLKQRGQDSHEVIQKRMLQAKSEMSHYHEYDYLIINHDFQQSLRELSAIVLASHLTQQQQSIRQQTLLATLL